MDFAGGSNGLPPEIQHVPAKTIKTLIMATVAAMLNCFIYPPRPSHR